MQADFHIPDNSRLQDYISMIWEVKGHENLNETILPQGIIEIIFNFSGKTVGMLPVSAKTIEAPRCFIQGVYTEVLKVNYTGQHHLLGIILQPHRVRSLLNILPSEINNRTVDLSLHMPVFDSLWHELAQLDSFDDKIKALEKGLPTLTDTVCDRSQALADIFFSENDPENFSSVDALAKQVCYSTRQLNRVVQELYGVSAEELTTYKKFTQSVKLIHTQPSSLTDVAYKAGFYDQAHFCRVFKQYTHMTPNGYRKQKGTTPFHIIS